MATCSLSRGDTNALTQQLGQLKLTERAQPINGQNGVPRQGELFDPNWKPAGGRSRGIGAENVYPKVAPSVVVVKLPNGHGTGFVIDSSGWIITNNHVAAEAVPDPQSGAQSVSIYFGKMSDDWMNVVDQPVKALVFKVSPQKDLALLKLVEPPPAGVTVVPLTLAAHDPRPGSECVAIGQPASASLWSVRTGQITGTGIFPDELTDVVITLLSLNGGQADQMRKQLSAAPKRRILYSNTGINSGDSGGPLVNMAGEVIGVSFAMPSFKEDQRQGTTSYHVALGELKEFLKERPAEPLIATDPWPDSALAELRDLTGSGRADALDFAPAEHKPWNAILFDLLHQSPSGITVDGLADPSQRSNWKYQFALQRGSICRAYYDTRGSGTIDLILAGPDLSGAAEVALRRVKGKWSIEPAAGRPLVSPDHFEDAALQEQFNRVIRRMGK